MIQYGLISQTDARTIEKTLDLVCSDFPNDKFIYTTEIGIFDGQTSRGINEYVNNKHKVNIHTAIDNNKDKPVLKPFYDCMLIIGNSTEVYSQLPDRSQHFIFVDGNHSFAAVIADFFCYAPKVKVGGYLAFHDTGKHISQFKDYQGVGSKDNPDSYISVRKALTTIGILGYSTFVKDVKEKVGLSDIQISEYLNRNKYYASRQWWLFFDEADETNEAGGVTVFKRLF